jgi:hypothetical protein
MLRAVENYRQAANPVQPILNPMCYGIPQACLHVLKSCCAGTRRMKT